MPLKGVILAAGKGSRLYPVTRHIPKPLLPLAGKPTIAYAFGHLKEMGIHEICVVVGENEAQMRTALGDGEKYGVALTYVRQTNPHGLAHAVGFAQEFVGEDPFVLYLGDAIYGGSFDIYAKRFLESGCANLNLVKPVEDPRRFGVANVDGERIVKLVEKPAHPESNLAMAGMYFFGPQIWSILPDLQPSKRGEFEITDAIQLLIDRGETVLAGHFEDVWIDTGTLDSFLEANRFVGKGGSRIGAPGKLTATVGGNVDIYGHTEIEAGEVEDTVILPGTTIEVWGSIRHCILGGTVRSDTSLENVIRWDDETE